MMLVALPYFAGDFSLALANLQLISDLGGVTDFPLLLVTDQTTSYAQRAEMQQLGLSAFKSVEPLTLDYIPNVWPQGPNATFERVALHIATAHPASPFLFLEPDATPTRPTWLREISAAYNAHGRLFMGAVRDTLGPVDPGTGKRMIGGKHMVGMGVYPPSFYFQSDIVRYLHTSPALGNRASGFDISLGDEIMLRGCYNSELFMHCWRTVNYREENGRVTCDRLDPLANFDEPNLRIPALIHGCKDASLIALVRANVSGLPKYEIPNGKPHVNYVPSTGKGDVATGCGDPEWAAFQAWKAHIAMKTNLAQSEVTQGVLPSHEIGQYASGQDRAISRTFQSSNGITFPSQEEIAAQRETMRSIVGNQAPAPVIPHEPTTQAELNAARMAAGGFGDELDNGFGVELPTGALTQADPMPPAVQVADIPVAREREASVASGSEVVAAEAVLTIPNLPRSMDRALASGNSQFAINPNVAALPHGEPPFQPLPASIIPPLVVESSPLAKKEESQVPAELASEIPSGDPIELSAENKEEAIKADIRAGVPYRERLKKWSVSSKEMKRISDLVDAEEAVEA